MKYKEIKKMINNVIENEFRHISEFREKGDFDSDNDITESMNEVDNAIKRLQELLPEQYSLISELESQFTNYCTAACKYYFREGVIAGTTSLKFLEETHIMNGI